MNTEDTLPDDEILEKKISRLTYLADFTCLRLKIDNNFITFIREQKSADEYSLKCATNGDKPKDYIWQYVHKKLSANGNVTKNANQRLFWMRNGIYLVKKFWTLGCLIPRNEMMHVIETGISSIDAYVCLQKLIYDDYYFPPKNERNFTRVRLTPHSKFFIPTNVCYILIANQPAIFKLISDKPEYSKLVEMKNLLRLAMEEDSRVEKPTGINKNFVTVDSSTECAGVDRTIGIDASSTECPSVDGTVGNSVCYPSTECPSVDKTVENSIYPSTECPSVDGTVGNSVCYPSTECPSVDGTIKDSIYPSTESVDKTIKDSIYPSTECVDRTTIYPSTECTSVDKTIKDSIYPSTESVDRTTIYPSTECTSVDKTTIYPSTECTSVDKTIKDSIYPSTECSGVYKTSGNSVYPPTECSGVYKTIGNSVYPPTEYGDEITIVYSTPGGKKMSPKKTSEQKTSRDKIMFYSGARGTSTDKKSGGDQCQDKITLYSTREGGKTTQKNVGTVYYDKRARIDGAGCSHEGTLDTFSNCNFDTNDISIADLPCIELSDVANELLMDYNYKQCKAYCFETITP